MDSQDEVDYSYEDGVTGEGCSYCLKLGLLQTCETPLAAKGGVTKRPSELNSVADVG